MIEYPVFRGLSDDFLADLKDKGKKVSFVLDYERDNREILITELRKNLLEFYFLGHGVVIKKKRDNKYYLSGSKHFNPASSSPSEWQICLDDIKSKDEFQDIMDSIISKIVIHRKGAISEGVSEINHFVDNRDIGKNGILIIDRQVVFPGTGDRIDLLGIRRLDKINFTFSVVELKNKNSIKIGEVFSQLKRYIDVVYENYDSFAKTYSEVIRQKVKLRLLKRIKFQIAPKEHITKSDIEGIAVLDNFNIKSDLSPNGLLRRAIGDWAKHKDDYSLRLYLKTNVLDDTFFLSYSKAERLLKKYKIKNS